MQKVNIGDKIENLPEDVIERHEIEKQGEDRGDNLYTMHKIFDFWDHHIQRILYDGAGYEIVFAGLYVFLDEKTSEWTLQSRH